ARIANSHWSQTVIVKTRQNRDVNLVAAALGLFVALIQTPAFKSHPPDKGDNCDEWNKPREPFKVFGNTYFVGTDGLSAILIVGDAGLILLDGGLEQSGAALE